MFRGFINSVAERAALTRRVDRPNMKMMPDVFHLNIEDPSIGGELARHIGDIGYLHLADSNRLAPGQGHLDLDDIFSHLKHAHYDGRGAVEILPRPDPDTAARQAADSLRVLRDAVYLRADGRSFLSFEVCACGTRTREQAVRHCQETPDAARAHV